MNTYTLTALDGGSIVVDDQATVYLNGNQIFQSPFGRSSFTLSFEATMGDVLRVTARDNYGIEEELSAMYLSAGVATVITKQISSYHHVTGIPWFSLGNRNYTFFDQSFTIDFQPEPKDDEKDRADKKCKCPDCKVGQATNSAPNAAGVALTYTSLLAGVAPASMGYGWSMGILQARLEFPVSGDLVFQDGSGSFERWVLEGGVYVAAHPDNYILAEENVDGSFTLTFRSQTKMNFNSEGELQTIVDRNSNTTTFTRNGSGHVTSVDDGEGRLLYVSYGSRTDGQPVSFRREDSSAGLEVQLVYDGNDRLWKTIQAEGETTEFLYNGNGLLWKKKDARGLVAVEYTYYGAGADEGKVETETHYAERLVTYTYTADTVTMVEEDLSPLTEDEPRTTVFTFRERSQLVRKEDSLGNVWEWEYDDLFNPYLATKTIDPNLNVTTYVFTPDGLLESVTDAQNNTTAFTYNQPGEDGYTAAKRYLLKEVQRPTVTVEGSPVNYAPSQFIYDSLGNLIEVKDSLDQSTLFEVGGDGRVTAITDRRGQEFVFDLIHKARVL